VGEEFFQRELAGIYFGEEVALGRRTLVDDAPLWIATCARLCGALRRT